VAFAGLAHPSKHAKTPSHNESAVATIDFVLPPFMPASVYQVDLSAGSLNPK
jgi:hypothetical protein